MRPWNHIHCLGFGLMMAHFYRHLNFYRRERDDFIRASRYPMIHRMHNTKKFGAIILPIGYCILLFIIIPIPIIFKSDNTYHPWLVNSIFFSTIQVLWITSIFINMMGFFTGNGNFFRTVLSDRQAIFLGKIIRVSTLLWPFPMYLFQNSWIQPRGSAYSYSFCQSIFWTGVVFVVLYGSIVTFFIEIPFYRLYQLLILPHITHDDLLQKWHDKLKLKIKAADKTVE